MRTALFLVGLFTSSICFSQQAQSLGNVTLKSGAILRNAQIVRWEKDRVVLKHAGGADPIPFSVLSAPDLERVLTMKAALEQPRKITGTVYVTTRGAGAYKFSSAAIVAYPQEAFADAKSYENLKKWPPLAGATTDANGQYAITIPNSKPAFLFCVTKRLVGGDPEINVWAVRVDADTIDLNERNSR